MHHLLVRGRVLTFGDDVNTDRIIPGWFMIKKEELGKYAFYFELGEGGLIKKVKEGLDIIVAGKHFGCGSSREAAPSALKHAGMKAVCAEFFARLFYRNAINLGLPLIECRGILDIVKEGDELEIDFKIGQIKNLTSGEILNGIPLPEFMQNIVNKGGLVHYLKSCSE